jgi:hypothetical protein
MWALDPNSKQLYKRKACNFLHALTWNQTPARNTYSADLHLDFVLESAALKARMLLTKLTMRIQICFHVDHEQSTFDHEQSTLTMSIQICFHVDHEQSTLPMSIRSCLQS